MGRGCDFRRPRDGVTRYGNRERGSLPAIAADLHAGPSDVIWVVNVCQIALVATLLPPLVRFVYPGALGGPRFRA
jgi:hypothetical protein